MNMYGPFLVWGVDKTGNEGYYIYSKNTLLLTTLKLDIISLLLPLSPERWYYNYVKQHSCCHKTLGFPNHMPPLIY